MIHNSLFKILIITLIVCLNWTGLSAVTGTFAYFNDIETSTDNVLTAGALDLKASPNNFDWQTPLPSPDENNTLAASAIDLENIGSLDFQYKITIATSTGDLCSNLTIANSTADTADLESFISNGQINASTSQDFNFSISLKENTDLNIHKEKSCSFKFLISAWQTEPQEMNENSGFNDSEEVLVNIKLMGHYDEILPEGDIVINEFLPIAGEFSEFVELYNKGNSDISISNWKICYTKYLPSDCITINTQIPSHGFYVIYPNNYGKGNNWLPDDSGIISLWKPDGLLPYKIVDAHTYDKDWGDIILPDKSYARIPDGSSNWVDPLPTPGASNELSEDELKQLLDPQTELLNTQIEPAKQDIAQSGNTSSTVVDDAAAPTLKIDSLPIDNAMTTEDIIVDGGNQENTDNSQEKQEQTSDDSGKSADTSLIGGKISNNDDQNVNDSQDDSDSAIDKNLINQNPVAIPDNENNSNDPDGNSGSSGGDGEDSGGGNSGSADSSGAQGSDNNSVAGDSAQD